MLAMKLTKEMVLLAIAELNAKSIPPKLIENKKQLREVMARQKKNGGSHKWRVGDHYYEINTCL